MVREKQGKEMVFWETQAGHKTKLLHKVRGAALVQVTERNGSHHSGRFQSLAWIICWQQYSFRGRLDENSRGALKALFLWPIDYRYQLMQGKTCMS